jgi:hypothetical protein
MVSPLIVFVAFGAVALAHPNSTWTSAAISAAAILPLGMIVAARYGSAAHRPGRNGFAICCGGYFLFFAFFADSPYLENLATSKVIDAYYTRLFPGSQASPLPSSGGGFNGGMGFGGPGFGSGGFGSGATGGGGFGGAADSDVAQSEPGKGTFAPEQYTEPAVPVSDGGAPGITVSVEGGQTITSVAPNAAQTQQQLQAEMARNFWLIGHAWWALLLGWVGACLAQFMARRHAQPEGHTNPTR